MGNKINSKNIYTKYLNQINGKHVSITNYINEHRSHYILENNIILEFKHYVNIYLDELKNKLNEYI